MNLKIANILFLIVLLSGLAHAAISLTDPTIPSSVVQGASFSLVMRVSGSTVQNVQGTVSAPTGVSCLPIAAQSITISDSAGSATWTCTGDASGDYTNQISLSVTAEDSSTAAALSDSATTGLIVQSPASLVVSSTLNQSSITTTGTVLFSVGVNNNGDASTTINIGVYANSSNVEITEDNATSVTVSGSSLVTRSWQATSATAGSYTLYAVVSSTDVGNSTTSREFTVTSASEEADTPAPAGGGGGGGGGGSGGSSDSTESTATQPIALTIDAGQTGTLKDFESSETGSKISIAQGGQVNYNYQNTQHKITVDAVNGTKVTITLSSNPITVTMAVGEEKSFDVTEDGVNDVKVKISSVNGNNVVMTITPLAVKQKTAVNAIQDAQSTNAPRAVQNDQSTSETSTNNVTSEAPISPITPIVIIVVVIILAALYFFVIRKHN